MDDCEAWLARRPEPLGWCFAAIGLVAGWASDDVGRGIRACIDWGPWGRFGRPDDLERLVLALVSALVYGIVGVGLARSLKEGRAIVWAAPMMVLGAGFFVGYATPFALDVGTPISALAAAIAGPWCALSAYGATRAWHAREHTIAQRMFRRVMWLGTLGYAGTMLARIAQKTLEHSSLWNALRGRESLVEVLERYEIGAKSARPGAIAPLVLGAAVLGLGAFAVAGAHDVARLCELRRRMNAERVPRSMAARHDDLGLGEDQVSLLVVPENPYRGNPRLVAHVRGSFPRVRHALVVGALGALILGVGLVSFFSVESVCR